MKIQNPRIMWHGSGDPDWFKEASDVSVVCGAFEYDGARFHIWLDPVTGKAENGARLYKNPPLGVDSTSPGYYHTRSLDSSAKVNRESLAELFANTDFAASKEAARDAYRQRQADAHKAEKEAAKLDRLQTLFVMSEEELIAVYDATGADTARIMTHQSEGDRYMTMLRGIIDYRFPYGRK